MLVTLKEILQIAEEKKIAVGSVNTPNIASIKAVIAAAEHLDCPVVLMHAQVHEEMGLCTMEEITPIMLMYARAARVPVCVHLDHGIDTEYVKRGLALGFTSVMYDGSELPYDVNVTNTRMIVEEAAKTGASVEAEMGTMGAREATNESRRSIYTEPDMAVSFVQETGIDALACAFGTAHGVYLKKPELDLPRLAKINSLIDIPLVMHGGSGVSEEEYKKVISLGIRKINYYTYMAIAGANAVKNTPMDQYHDVEQVAIKAMTENIEAALKIFIGQEDAQ